MGTKGQTRPGHRFCGGSGGPQSQAQGPLPVLSGLRTRLSHYWVDPGEPCPDPGVQTSTFSPAPPLHCLALFQTGTTETLKEPQAQKEVTGTHSQAGGQCHLLGKCGLGDPQVLSDLGTRLCLVFLSWAAGGAPHHLMGALKPGWGRQVAVLTWSRRSSRGGRVPRQLPWLIPFPYCGPSPKACPSLGPVSSGGKQTGWPLSTRPTKTRASHPTQVGPSRYCSPGGTLQVEPSRWYPSSGALQVGFCRWGKGRSARRPAGERALVGSGRVVGDMGGSPCERLRRSPRMAGQNAKSQDAVGGGFVKCFPCIKVIN